MARRPDMARIDTPAGFVCLCIIGSAHGVRGAVKVKCFAEDSAELAAYGALVTGDGRAFNVTSVKPNKSGARLTLEGVNDRTAAEALRGTALFVARDKLPPLPDDDDFYHADLIGLTAYNGADEIIGAVQGVHNFGAGDLLEIAAQTGKTAFYRFTKAVVPEIDLTAGRLTLLAPKEDEARPPEAEGE
jgi:16S rRNA processing protein RimM